ncbi:LLM class flavin-dependent oxidoreductase [Nocardia bovistercoris]|uniref:LLM class flavin-dependent oxidoreductase n=1 Tax=Nocardia bovistercoris TaxID=2785916 RepID=A0A931N4A7_9NOCA|nr:LLM class flavin-dependent oxidoreductase [Nocardia bovistercoris]MBH0778056.1 LLM class flavin-dependent oxidoreductase [Nocardia bovistercoris]
MSDFDIGVYLPQIGFTYPELLHRAQRCEDLGIGSLWLYDHLYGPGADEVPSLEAWTLATALLSRTERLRVGHLVLCNQFRHPALLAKMVSTLMQVAPGRFLLGLGSGSIEEEHLRTGLAWGTFAERSERLAETLEILFRATSGSPIDVAGTHYTLREVPIVPPIKPRPPIVIGGVGEKHTLPLVARYADIWNIPTYALGDLEYHLSALDEHCARIGRDRASITLSVQAVMALSPDESALPEVRRRAERHFGAPGYGLAAGGLVGTAPMIVDRLEHLRSLGIGQVVLFTHDRASDNTLELLSTKVISAFGPPVSETSPMPTS